MIRSNYKRESKLWLIALLASLGLNFVFILLATALYVNELAEMKKLPVVKWVVSPEFFKVNRQDSIDQSNLRKAEKEKQNELAEVKTDQEKQKPPYLRTVKDQESKERPKDPAFIGKHDTQLASEREASPDGFEFLPSADGKKKKDDEMISLVDQRAQMGDLQEKNDVPAGQVPQIYLGRNGTHDAEPLPPTPPGEVTPPLPPSDNTADIPYDPSLATRETVDATHENDVTIQPGETDSGVEGDDSGDKSPYDLKETEQLAEESPADPDVRPNDLVPDDVEKGDLLSIQERLDKKQKALLAETEAMMRIPEHLLPQKATPLLAGGASEGEEGTVLPQIPHIRSIHDPARQFGGRPGYKGESRKTRVTGQMSMSGRVAANVSKTALGQYVSLFFRTMNRHWDNECSRNRELILPGSLKIRFVINGDGTASDIRLYSKVAGTRAIQQSFTYQAIERTRIQKMPPEVIREAGEDKIEVVVDFYFQ